MPRPIFEIFKDALDCKDDAKLFELANEIDVAGNALRRSGNLAYHAHLDHTDHFAPHFAAGEYYVYLWRHLNGAPFYVGFGKGDRWLVGVRNQRFGEETAKRDAVVYKVVCGLDERTARDIEFCLIHKLSKAGYTLAQTNYVYSLLTEEGKARQDARYEKKSDSTEFFHASIAVDNILASSWDIDVADVYEELARR